MVVIAVWAMENSEWPESADGIESFGDETAGKAVWEPKLCG